MHHSQLLLCCSHVNRSCIVHLELWHGYCSVGTKYNMKKVLVFTGLLFSLTTSFSSNAQVHVNVQFGTPVVQERWYASDNDYYYLPEQGVYYNVRRKVYVYPEGGKWLYANRLPSRYGNYSYRSSKYVRVRDRSPFDKDNDYRKRYYRGKNENNNNRNDGRDERNKDNRDRRNEQNNNHNYRHH